MLQNLFLQPEKKVFLQTQNKKYDYLWLQQGIKKRIKLWQALNLNQDNWLFLAISDDVEMAISFLSALIAGVPVIIGDPIAKAFWAKAIIKRAQPACIIADEAILEQWQLPPEASHVIIPFAEEEQARPGLLARFLQKNKIEQQGNDYAYMLKQVGPLDELPPAPMPDNLAYIIFTSGTTSNPKGVMITHRSLKQHLNTLQKVYNLQAPSKVLNQLPLTFTDGCIQGAVLTAFVGCSWHRPFPFTIDKIPFLMDYCYSNAITHMFVVPAILSMMLQFAEGYEESFQYPEFEAIISSADHLAAPLWDEFESTFNVSVSNVYGLSETVAGSLYAGPLKETYRKYTVGKPIDCDAKIINDQGEKVGQGMIGELCLKGPHVMRGYLDEPDLTQEVIKEGWFHTGDLALEDEDGFIIIQGRKKNLIISGGVNIHPEEVTECLLQHADVIDAYALGMPDDTFGEKLIAVVVLKPNTNVETLDMIEHSRQFLEPKKVPQTVHILQHIPKTASGKVQVDMLREQLKSPISMSIENQHGVVNQVIALASQVFKVPSSRLDPQASTHSVVGWDSSSHLAFVATLERAFNIRFSAMEVIQATTIKKVVDFVTAKAPSSIS